MQFSMTKYFLPNNKLCSFIFYLSFITLKSDEYFHEHAVITLVFLFSTEEFFKYIMKGYFF